MDRARLIGAAGEPHSPPGDDWLQPPEQERGIGFYLLTVRERLLTVIVVVAVTLGAALFYLARADDVYEAQADLIVSAAPSDAELLASLGLPLRSTDPRREAQTAALLITSHEVAERALGRLQGVPEAQGDAASLLISVTAAPIGESNLVAITAEAADPDDAAAIANAFARAAIAERTAVLLERIDESLARLRAGPVENAEVQRQLAQLEGLRAQNQDPTLQLGPEAQPPASPSWPRPLLTVAGAILGGLVLGLGAAFTQQTLDPRLRREEQLRQLYRLPILARIPRETRRRPRAGPLMPGRLSPPVAEAYRSLRGALAASSRGSGDGARVILVTGSSPAEGKTTTAVNAAASLAGAGKRVILIEGDVRRPTISRALGVESDTGLVSVLLESVPLEEALVTAGSYEGHLSVLLADYEGDWISDLLALPVARRAIEGARSIADFVIIDSPPLVDVVDALPLLSYVDEVLLVVRLGTTRIDRLVRLGELLAEHQVKPVGLAVIEAARSGKSQYHYSARERRLLRPARREGKPRDGADTVAAGRERERER